MYRIDCTTTFQDQFMSAPGQMAGQSGRGQRSQLPRIPEQYRLREYCAAYHAAWLSAGLGDVQNAVAPEDPASDGPPQGKWQDNQGGGNIPNS